MQGAQIAIPMIDGTSQTIFVTVTEEKGPADHIGGILDGNTTRIIGEGRSNREMSARAFRHRINMKNLLSGSWQIHSRKAS
jgi:hypothetical protein